MKLKSYFNAIENLFTFFAYPFLQLHIKMETMPYQQPTTTHHPPNWNESFQWESEKRKIIWTTSRNENIVSFRTTHARCYPFHKNWSSFSPTPSHIVSRTQWVRSAHTHHSHQSVEQKTTCPRTCLHMVGKRPFHIYHQDERILSVVFEIWNSNPPIFHEPMRVSFLWMEFGNKNRSVSVEENMLAGKQIGGYRYKERLCRLHSYGCFKGWWFSFLFKGMMDE